MKELRLPKTIFAGEQSLSVDRLQYLTCYLLKAITSFRSLLLTSGADFTVALRPMSIVPPACEYSGLNRCAMLCGQMENALEWSLQNVTADALNMNDE